MPDAPNPKSRPHPAKEGGTTPKWHQGWGGFRDEKGRVKQLAEELGGGGPTVMTSGGTVAFAELCCTSNFTFLTGASHPDEVAKRAAELGYAAFGVCDTNTLAGVVRAHVEAERQGVRQVVGSRVELSDGQGIYVWPTDLAAYGRLATLLTVGKLRAKKGQCLLGLWDVLEHAEGQMFGVEVPAHHHRCVCDDAAHLAGLVRRDQQRSRCWRRGTTGQMTNSACATSRGCRPRSACRCWRRTGRCTMSAVVGCCRTW